MVKKDKGNRWRDIRVAYDVVNELKFDTVSKQSYLISSTDVVNNWNGKVGKPVRTGYTLKKRDRFS